MSPRDPTKLTRRQSDIADFIRDYTRDQGYSPSVRDIGQRFGVNPATVHDHLKALERKGVIEREPGLSRSVRVVGPGSAAPGSAGPGVPLVGHVAAGSPILAEQNIEEYVPLPADWASDGAFLLRVHGDSMRDAHILDGDMVLVRPQTGADNGEIVVAMIDGEATVKRFFRKDGSIELRAENAAFAPIRVSPDEGRDFGIAGRVVGVFRV